MHARHISPLTLRLGHSTKCGQHGLPLLGAKWCHVGGATLGVQDLHSLWQNGCELEEKWTKCTPMKVWYKPVRVPVS